MTTRKYIFIALPFIFAGCSFIEKTLYFDSNQNSRWERKTTTNSISSVHSETFVLRDSANNEIGLIIIQPSFNKLLFLGPPLIPVIPFFEMHYSTYSGDLRIRGQFRSSNIQLLNELLSDSTGTIVINDQIRLPVKIKPS